MRRRQAVELPRLKLHQQWQMQNHEGELRQRRKGREDEVAGGDSGELPPPGRRPPCQLLLLLSDQLMMIGLLLEGGRWVGRGPAPRIALLSAPSHHREGSRNCELCSPSQWSQLHRPLPGPHREESHLLLARPALPPVAPSHSLLPSTGNPPQSRSRNPNPWRVRFLHN